MSEKTKKTKKPKKITYHGEKLRLFSRGRPLDFMLEKKISLGVEGMIPLQKLKYFFSHRIYSSNKSTSNVVHPKGPRTTCA